MSTTRDTPASGGTPEHQPALDAYPAVLAAGEQGLLFEAGIAGVPEDLGYRGPTACAAAGITYRQLDYWARTGLVEPSIRPAHGSGTQRLYGFRDILVLKIVKRLLDAGVSLGQIRQAVTYLRHRGIAELASVTLMSDGATVYECTSPGEVVDILAGGQGVFGIAVGRVWREVEGSLAQLPGERPAAEATAETTDELAQRRARRIG
jgi:DNA-binding transcriptional MerR regulator